MPREKRLSASSKKGESIDELKNDPAPAKFWQFAWLFNSKSKEKPGDLPVRLSKSEETPLKDEESKLAKIKEEPYEGELSNSEPLFQLSMW